MRSCAPPTTNRHRDGRAWDTADFHLHPENYESTFGNFLPLTDLLIACAYWHPAAPHLFSAADTQQPDFRINTIADVTCDVDGSIPVTRRSTTIQEPAFDYVPGTGALTAPYSAPDNITVMAVDNLPCELPRNASRDFGRQLLDNVFPHLLSGDAEGVIERATIAKAGQLMPRYAYLADYVALENWCWLWDNKKGGFPNGSRLFNIRFQILERLLKPVLDVFHGVAGFLLQLAEPLILLAISVIEIIIGEVAPLLLGLAFNLVPVTASFELGLVVDVILVDIHD